MELKENTRIKYLFRKNDGEEITVILSLSQIEGAKGNFYNQIKRMLKDDGDNWKDWEIVSREIVEE